MYAIIATGGKQYKVSEGDIITIEKLGVEAGEKVTFDQVLSCRRTMISRLEIQQLQVQQLKLSVVKEGRAKKVIVYKYKRKTGYHKKNGHRQAFTQVKIEKINAISDSYNRLSEFKRTYRWALSQRDMQVLQIPVRILSVPGFQHW